MKHWFYRRFMRFAHKHGWHHVTTSHLVGGDIHNKCQWCGLTEVLKHNHFAGVKLETSNDCPKNTIILTNLKVPSNY